MDPAALSLLDPSAFQSAAQVLYNGIHDGNLWPAAIALALIGTLLVRALFAKRFPVLATPKGLQVTSVVVDALGAAVNTYIAGGHVDTRLLAITLINMIVTVLIFSRPIGAAKEEPAAASAQRGSARVHTLMLLAAVAGCLLLVSCTPAQNDGWRRFGGNLLNKCAEKPVAGVLQEGLGALADLARGGNPNGNEIGMRLAERFGLSTAICIGESAFDAWGGQQLEDGTLHGAPSTALLAAVHLHRTDQWIDAAAKAGFEKPPEERKSIE